MLTSDALREIVTHMNQDHADAVLAYAKAYAGHHDAAKAQLLHITTDCMHIEVVVGDQPREIVIPLTEPMTTVGDARRVLIKMARDARKQLG